MNENNPTVPPSTEPPITLLTLPRELRDEILTYVALSSSFTFLRTCRRLNEEGTPLLYKHASYCKRALTLRRERKHGVRLPGSSKPPPFHLLQNLYITMPPTLATRPNYEVPRSTISLLERFRGTEIRRRVCHFDLRYWTLSTEMAKGLRGLVGFEVVRVQVRRWFGAIYFIKELDRMYSIMAHCARLMDKSLGPALGKATWESTEYVTYGGPAIAAEVVFAAEFRPWRSAS